MQAKWAENEREAGGNGKMENVNLGVSVDCVDLGTSASATQQKTQPMTMTVSPPTTVSYTKYSSHILILMMMTRSGQCAANRMQTGCNKRLPLLL